MQSKGQSDFSVSQSVFMKRKIRLLKPMEVEHFPRMSFWSYQSQIYLS